MRRYDAFLVEAARRAGLAGDGRVLDVGCGPTCCAAMIPGGRKWYVDPLIDEYAKGDNLPDGERLAAYIEDAELPDGFFDLAVCLNALDHVWDPWKALEIIYRTLRPGGIFLCSLYTRRPLLASLRNLQEYLGLSTDVAHPYSFTVSAASHALRRAGFDFEAPRTLAIDRDRAETIWCCTKPASDAAPGRADRCG